jgi:iron complex transport system ATP-binding protein
MAAEEVLRLRDVTVERDGRTLLRALDWTVAEGERWVVLGPNGAGKTTLLQVAGAEVLPAAGEVRILQESPDEADIAELRTRVGLCSAGLADRLPRRERVLDVVATAAHGVLHRRNESFDDADIARAAVVMAGLGTSALAARRYGSLSEGERKRVQIARALMADPELLLLDEPAAGLDLGGREDLVRRLSRLAADPAAPTMVLVTHHVEEIPPAATHALLLRAGRVVAAGEIDAVLTAPALSACFGIRLALERTAGRYVARAAAAG